MVLIFKRDISEVSEKDGQKKRKARPGPFHFSRIATNMLQSPTLSCQIYANYAAYLTMPAGGQICRIFDDDWRLPDK
jgi:hypothetical protein